MKKAVLLIPILLSLMTLEVFSQACPNNLLPPNGRVGIQNTAPAKLLEITGTNGVVGQCSEQDPAIRLSYYSGTTLSYFGHLALLTQQNLSFYTLLTPGTYASPGDMVLQAGPEANDIILTTRNNEGNIRLATTPNPGAPDIERVRVTPNGKVGINLDVTETQPLGILDINLMGWNRNLPKISFNQTASQPSIRLYKPVGDPGNPTLAYPFWIENNQGRLLFKNEDNYPSYDAIMGTEAPTTRVIFHRNGNVGINVPDADLSELKSKFQVNNGNVLFKGSTFNTATDIVESGQGRRFMWVPSKAALRAGEITEDQWDLSNLGLFSLATGVDNIASGGCSVSFGFDNASTQQYSFTMGRGNIASGEYSFAQGDRSTASGEGSLSVGYRNMSSGYWSFVIGVNSEANHNYSTAFGDQLHSLADYSQAFGHNTWADGPYSTTMGCYNTTNGFDGSFFLSDNNGSPGHDNAAPSDNNDEIILKFTGDDSTHASDNYSFRLFTSYDPINKVPLTGIQVYHGSNSIYEISDRNLKKNINPVNVYDFLNHLRKVPISTWQVIDYQGYKDTNLVWYEGDVTWIGPMAQDFYREFPYGICDSAKLSTSNMRAAMWASIQALANISDSLGVGLATESKKSEQFDTKINSYLLIEDFESFKDTISCYRDICSNVLQIENDLRDKVSFNEFNSFKDTIRCYIDACRRIEELENEVADLRSRLEALENNGGGFIDEEKNNGTPGIQSSKDSEVLLFQNNPNPFSETTSINYYIPGTYEGIASIAIYNENGVKQIQKHNACIGKPCQITISSKDLSTGVYIYAIVINGRILNSEKMMVIK